MSEEMNNVVETTENVDTATTEEQAKTYTEEEYLQAIEDAKKSATKGLLTQNEVDAIVKERIARQKRLSEMSDDEKASEEVENLKEALEQEKLKNSRIILEQDTINVLATEGIPIQFKDFLIGDDAESTNETIKSFKAIYNKAITEAVNEQLKGKTVKAPGEVTVTKDVWANLRDKYKK